MSDIVREFFVESVSGSTVSLKRSRTVGPLPDTCGGMIPLSIILTTGLTTATSTEVGRGAFWKANCTPYRVTIERKG